MPLCAGHDKCGNLSADRIEQQIAHLAHPCSVAQIDHFTGQCSSENRMVFCI